MSPRELPNEKLNCVAFLQNPQIQLVDWLAEFIGLHSGSAKPRPAPVAGLEYNLEIKQIFTRSLRDL
jgi:hypothetical protein